VTPRRRGDVDQRGRHALSLRRRLLFAALATLALFAALEGALRVAGVEPAPSRTTTWFADHILRLPFVNLHDEEGRSWVSAGQPHHFRPFAPDAATDTFRVAVFGGSAAQGYGVLPPGAFPHRTEQLLQAASPDREVRVVNFGAIAWSSQQIAWAVPYALEIGRWDLLVVYSGHNELLELASWKDYMTAGQHRRYTRALLLAQRLSGLRLYALLQRGLSSDAPPEQVEEASTVPPEERARLGRLERRYAARTWSHNIGRVVDAARDEGVPVIVMNPAPNDLHDPQYYPWPGEDGERFEQLLQDTTQGGDAGAEAARAALAMHPKDPRALYAMAQWATDDGPPEAKLDYYVQARRHAEYPNRVMPEVSDAIRAFGRRSGVIATVDVEARFRAESPTGTLEYGPVYDHCHLSSPANWRVAAWLAEAIVAEGLLPAPDGWTFEDVAAEGIERYEALRAPDPRIHEWAFIDWKDGLPEYVADAAGQLRAELERLEAAIEAPDASAEAWLWAGNGRFLGYDVGGALDAWERAAELDPTLCVAVANRARGLRWVGDREAALEVARQAFRCDPGDAGVAAEVALLERLTK